MRKIICLILLFQICLLNLLGQSAPLPPVDKSPMDMSYFPVNYPVLKIQDKISGSLVARVLYSRPKKEGRAIFGGLVEYGKLWRMGANEATEIEFFKAARINGKKVSKGRYTLYAIPYESSWTIIINKETDTWGHFKYDAKKDVVRIDVPVQKSNDLIESFAIQFEKTSTGAELIIAWDLIRVELPITFN